VEQKRKTNPMKIAEDFFHYGGYRMRGSIKKEGLKQKRKQKNTLANN
jgi:hypothetical protein